MIFRFIKVGIILLSSFFSSGEELKPNGTTCCVNRILTTYVKKKETQTTTMEELEQLAKLIEGGKSKRILVLCGAGVSTGTVRYGRSGSKTSYVSDLAG